MAYQYHHGSGRAECPCPYQMHNAPPQTRSGPPHLQYTFPPSHFPNLPRLHNTYPNTHHPMDPSPPRTRSSYPAHHGPHHPAHSGRPATRGGCTQDYDSSPGYDDSGYFSPHQQQMHGHGPGATRSSPSLGGLDTSRLPYKVQVAHEYHREVQAKREKALEKANKSHNKKCRKHQQQCNKCHGGSKRHAGKTSSSGMDEFDYIYNEGRDYIGSFPQDHENLHKLPDKAQVVHGYNKKRHETKSIESTRGRNQKKGRDVSSDEAMDEAIEFINHATRMVAPLIPLEDQW